MKLDKVVISSRLFLFVSFLFRCFKMCAIFPLFLFFKSFLSFFLLDILTCFCQRLEAEPMTSAFNK